METGPVIIEPPDPLVYDDSIDTTNMSNVLLIDSILHDKQVFYESANANTFPIIYDSNSRTDDLLALLRQKFPASSIQRISLVFHDRGPNIQARFMNNNIFFQESDLEVNQTSFSENVSFLISCIKEFNVAYIDFLACNTLQYSNWQSYYALLASETPVVVGASNNETGNINYGGDWVMESTGEDVMNVYFNANISNYVSLLGDTIMQSGGTITLKMDTLGQFVEYSSNGGGYTSIPATSWPITIENLSPSAGNILRVVLTTDITLTTTYTGDINSYLIAGSDYITFDGSSNTITMNNIMNYPGFIQNGTISSDGFANVIVQNFTTTITGSSTLLVDGGWLCQSYFGAGVGGNTITGCTNLSAGIITATNAGGIAGSNVGSGLGGVLTITNCTNEADISITATSAGGIIGSDAGSTSGLVTITKCFSTGNITGQEAGGIAGSGFATNTSQNCIIGQCYSIGNIGGTNAGGITGSNIGYSSSSSYTPVVDISNCYSLGTIATATGGICGGWNNIAYTKKPAIRITNSYSYGALSGTGAGLVAVSLTSPTSQINLTTPNTYVAAGTWIDANANASGALIGYSMDISTNTGITWTKLGTNIPYILSAYNAQLYNPNSDNATSDYLTNQGLIQQPGITYSIFKEYQGSNSNVLNTYVFASKVKVNSPYYYSYNSNSFALTNTNANGSDTTMTSTIPNSTDGKIEISVPAAPVPLVITANSSTQSVYLRINALRMEYSLVSSTGPWNIIYTYVWPVTIINSNSGSSSALRVVATQALTMSSNTGGVSGYFIAGSTYITFDGSGNTITMNTITSYPGLIQNGTSPTAPGFANVIVQNFTTTISGSSTLLSGGGWLCQSYFGAGVSGNTITGCTNLSAGVIGATNAGGIAGSNVGSGSGGVLTITKCTNAADISSTATSAGGIIGSDAGSTSGLVTITKCFSTGNITGQQAGGIVGSGFATNTSQNCIIGQCYSIGNIGGTNAGGITGSNIGYNSSSSYTPVVDISNCYSLGTIAATTGGICGGLSGVTYSTPRPIIRITNSYSYGLIASGGAGIVASSLTSVITPSQTNTYFANNSWNDIVANASLANTPTNINTNNPGTTWTMIASGKPYVLSAYNEQLYNPNSADASSNYTTTPSLYGTGFTYTTLSKPQITNVLTTYVSAFKGTSPYYYSYNSNSFALTNTNINGSDTSMTSSINTSNGVLVISVPAPPVPLIIDVSGSAQSVYLRMNGTQQIEYGFSVTGPWNKIYSYLWPVTINNLTPASSTILRVVVTNNLTISNTYGNTSGYFIMGTQYITFDGSFNSININGITTGYPGFIQNSRSNIVVQKFRTDAVGSVLDPSGGWLCQANFGISSTGNFITDCSNNGAVIGTNLTGDNTYSGGIAGRNAGDNGALTFTNCRNYGNISAWYGGGIAGGDVGTSGALQFINCTNYGEIIGSNQENNYGPGGIVGDSAGKGPSSSLTFTNCTNYGAITASDGGGIAGGNCASSGGTAAFTDCVNNGNLNGDLVGAQRSGGIVGYSAASSSGTCTITNCSNNGLIETTKSGGIVGARAGNTNGRISLTNCFNTGLINSTDAGGIVGDSFGYNTNFTPSISACYSTADINGTKCGGIAGADIGYSNISHSVDISNCYSLGSISDSCGGIIGGKVSNYSSSSSIAINIKNCYSFGTTLGTGQGIVAVSMALTPPSTITQLNCYAAKGNWTDASANAILTGYPTDISANNPGTTWTTLETNRPYVLSAYIAQLYNPSSNSASTSYSTPEGLFQPDFNYRIIKQYKTAPNVYTTYVFASKGLSPYYYSYNYNSFALTNTSTSPESGMSSTINDSNGILTITILAPDGPLTITANGAVQSIYLRMNDSLIEFGFSVMGPWNIISATNWPVTIINSNPGSSSKLNVIFMENLIISNTYGGNTTGYFITGTQYITIDGANYNLNINNIINYSGFIDGFNRTNIEVKNIKTNVNSSTLATYAGWICRTYFGYGGRNNFISNCTNNGTINADYGGGIAGYYSGYNGILSITNCTNTGAITGQYAGGISGSYTGSCYYTTIPINTITLDISGCTNNGAISGFSAGGIVGPNSGSGRYIIGFLQTSVLNRAVSRFTNCTNTGNITAQYGGGIAGRNVGNNNSSNSIVTDGTTYGLTFINCNNTGSINSIAAGGIVGQFAGVIGSVKFDKCTNTGNILINTSGGGGIAGGSANRATFNNCANSGDIIGINSGGIAGENVFSDLNFNTTLCSNTGAIIGRASGGILGQNATMGLYQCYSSGIISGQYAGGIAGAFYNGGSSIYRYINNCYSTGDITGQEAGGIVGSDVGYNNGTLGGIVDISNCYSLGKISGLQAGGIVGGSINTAAINLPAINIRNCYSYGIISNGSAGILSPGYISSSRVFTSNCYIANGNWSDASANASLTGDPISLEVNNPGTIWTTISNAFIPSVPYILSSFNAALYNPATVVASSNYSTTPGLFQPNFNYSIIYSTQSGNTITTRVFASKGTTPYYYAYNFNRFVFTNVSPTAGIINVAINQPSGILNFTLPINNQPIVTQIPTRFTPYAESPNNLGQVIYTDPGYFIVPDISNNPTYILSTNVSYNRFNVFQNSTTIPAAFIPNSLFINNNLISPTSIVKDSIGNFYVGSNVYNVISVFNNNGVYLRKISVYSSINIPLNTINYMAIDSSNNLYITSESNSGVYVVPAGSNENNLTQTILKYSYGNDFRGVACNRNYLYIVVKRSSPAYTIKYDVANKTYLQLDLSGNITTGQPVAIIYNNINASLPPLYITTIDGSNNSIYTISDISGNPSLIGGIGTATINFLTRFPNNQYPYSLTMDNSANLYVGLDEGRNIPVNVNSVGKIARVTSTGVISTPSYLTYNGLGIGRPEGLLFDGSLNLYATDILHNRVIKSRPKTFVFGTEVLNADAFYVKDPFNPTQYKTYLYNTTNSSITTTFNLTADCFQKGTKILCENDIYVPIENIKVGDLVKTYKHGYQKVTRCVTRRSGDYVSSLRNQIYTYTQKSNPELIEDLYLTGGHSLLVDELSETESNDMKQSDLVDSEFMVEDKYKLMCCFNKKLEVSANQYVELYRFTLEPPENATPTHVYGIWANGILSESSSKASMDK